MDKNFSSIEVECECGEVHELLSLKFFKNSIDELCNYLEEKNILCVRLFIESKLASDTIIAELISKLKQLNITLKLTKLDIKHTEVFRANSILFEDEEYIIVFGDDPIIELVKYYAYSMNLNYSIIINREIYDFTFSKFARLYDGIHYGFYNVESPELVVFYEKNNIDIIKIQKYLGYKNIAYFENLLLEKLEEPKFCSKINSKLKKFEKISNYIVNDIDAVYSLIFLGRTISFFNGTKGFFGSEMDIANILECLTKKSFMDCYLLSSSVICRIYSFALSSNLKVLNLNLNRRIGKIKRILKLPATKCISFIKKNKPFETLNKHVKIVKALKYMLLNLIETDEQKVNIDISPKSLAYAIYIAPEFSMRYTFLNLIRDLGYLENLI